MSGEASFQSAWQRSGQKDRSGSLAEARGRLPHKLWESLHTWIVESISSEEDESMRWRGHRMIGVDGTGVSMGSHPELIKHFGQVRSQYGLSRFPTSRVSFTFNLKTLVTLGQEMGHCHTGEKALFNQLRRGLQKTDVLVFDRYYSGGNLYATYQREGFEYIGRTHQRLKVEKLKGVASLGKEDMLVKMPVQKPFRDKDAKLPKFVIVRLLKVAKKGRGKRRDFWVATSLLNPKRYPADEIRNWYKKRWKVETLIGEIKRTLGAHLLRSKSVEGIRKELWARTVAFNLIHWLILKAASSKGIKPDQVSVTATLRLATAFSLKMSVAPIWQLPSLYQQLIQRIALSKVPHRPGRMEPRMICRDPHRYPRLAIPRSEWRIRHALAA